MGWRVRLHFSQSLGASSPQASKAPTSGAGRDHDKHGFHGRDGACFAFRTSLWAFSSSYLSPTYSLKGLEERPLKGPSELYGAVWDCIRGLWLRLKPADASQEELSRETEASELLAGISEASEFLFPAVSDRVCHKDSAIQGSPQGSLQSLNPANLWLFFLELHTRIG